MNENGDLTLRKLDLGELLAIDEFMLVEESYAAQRWIGKTLEYLGKVRADDVLEVLRIFDESDELIGLALHDKDLKFWIIFTDLIADRARKEEFRALARMISGPKERVLAVKRKAFHEAMVEFYSVGLVNRLFCDCNVKEERFYPRGRIEALKKVLGEFLRENEIQTGAHTAALEIGCGNGGATIALHELGLSPLTVDIDKCEICKGLEEGVLDPRKSIVLDCSLLSSFFGREFDVVFGFMVGKLTPFERFNWDKVLLEAPKVLKSNGKVLFTVSSEEEAEIVHQLLQDVFTGDVKENKESDGYFDRWIYTGTLCD
ncbi:MAG: methyltransferase domain-containing protein [Methanophagales archaeon ANME-1-THS]|nr:MAG: methyltransferase domain-containing protein [Methanophagales archaeon ANME-1-THS]